MKFPHLKKFDILNRSQTQTQKSNSTYQPSISPIKFILIHFKRDRSKLAISIIWSIVFVILPMQIPILTGALIDGLHRHHVKLFGIIELPHHNNTETTILYIAMGLLGIAILYGVAAFFRTNTIAKASRHFVSEIRKAMFYKFEILSLDIHSYYGAGELLSRAIVDTQSLRTFIENTIIKTITNFVRSIYPFIVIFIMDPYLALLASSILPAQWIIARHLQKKLHLASRKSRTSSAVLITSLKENLDGIETIQTLNAGKSSFNKVSKLAEEVEYNQIQTQRYSGMISGIVWLLTSLGLTMVWYQGGLDVVSDRMTIGGLVAFTGLVLFIYQPLRNFTNVLTQYQKGIVAAERIQEILDMESSISDNPGATDLKINQGNIEFKNVYLSLSKLLLSSSLSKDSYSIGTKTIAKAHIKSYKDKDKVIHENILNNINLNIEYKNLIGIVGRSGSGKSTLLKLIARLYDTSLGEILIDNQNIKGVKLNSLRSQIAIVPQLPIIFSGTIKENIILAKPDATDEEIKEACIQADALNFIETMTKGFDTRLGQGGITLSGGQIQRIAIARVLIKKPKILLLDEPSSALDAESEYAIMNTLHYLKKHMTIIIVGHHLKAMSRADRIIVMDKGKIMENGTHEELISYSGIYKYLYSHNEENSIDNSFSIKERLT